MAEDTLQKCMDNALLGRLPPSATANLKLVGAASGRKSMTDSPSLLSYGAEAAVVQSLPGADIELAPGFSVAMVRFAARYEYARTVEDVLARRTRLLFLDARSEERRVGKECVSTCRMR